MNTKKITRLLVYIITALLLASPGFALQIGDVTLPDTLKAGNANLLLNGGGWRKKFVLKIYVGGLYLQQKTKDAKKIIAADEPMAIKLHIVSGLIDSEKMINAVKEGFEKSTGGNVKPIQAKIDQFTACFSDKISPEDVFDIVYVPGQGTTVTKNGAPKGTITGLDFKKPLFGIWLCDEPADDGLKEGMLGEE